MRALAVAVLVLVVGCMPAGPAVTPSPAESPDEATPTPATTPQATSPVAAIGEIIEARSDAPRNPLAAATTEQLAEMVAADRAFAFDLYRTLVAEEDGNLFMSPYSISTAMSIVLAGARGQTADELAAALAVDGAGDFWHEARNRLVLELAAIADVEWPGEGDGVPLTLEPTNAVFGQAGYPFKPDFLDILAANYGAGMNAVDFITQWEASRVAINEWVAERTRDRIEELLPEGSITDMTRAVLVNAIYFKANWIRQFDPELTDASQFHLLDSTSVEVQMMHGSARRPYAAADGWQAVELSYHGGPSMVIIVPEDGRFADIEAQLDADVVAQIDDQFSDHIVDLSLPRWETASDLDLIPPLQSLGVELLFDRDEADLTGIADVEQLFISNVLHQANITVDEEGTEAAAATAAIGEATSAPPPATLTVDRPFIYLIRDGASGEILFLGRLLEP